MSLVQTALELASIGLPVFPLKANKRPTTEDGFKAATTDPNVIARLFANPLAVLIGVPTGEVSGIDILDVDPKNGGAEWLAANEHLLPATRRHATRSGGVHALFKHTAGMRNSASRIAPGVDIRADGGYAVWWPAHGFPDRAGPLAEFPDFIKLEAMRTALNPATPTPEAEDLAPPSAADLIALISDMPNPDSATRDDWTAVNLAVQGCARALDALDREHDPEAIYDAAAEWSARWDGPNPGDFEAERARWVDDWSQRTRDVSGWRQLVALAGKFGADVSRYVLAAAQSDFTVLPPEPDAPAAAAPRTAKTPDQPAVNESTEDAIASGFAADMRDRVLFDHAAGAWFMWSDVAGAWVRDESARGFAAVREYVRQVRALFGGGPDTSKLASASTVASVERLARTDPRLAVSSAVWDLHPWLLGVPGGIVDLHTGDLLAADPGRRMTKQTAVAPAPAGTPMPVFAGFILEACGGDARTVDFIQRLLGYCITGDVSEEIIPFLYGEGGRGKGTLMHVVGAIIGSYGVQMPADTFAANSDTKGEYARARMAGARLVMASETGKSIEWDESALKELSGNEGMISAREPHGRMFEYRAGFKIIIVGNYAPSLPGGSKAMERRLRVVPFNSPPARVDITLKARLVEEYPQILRWLIDGCMAWQREGVGNCPAVLSASRAYFDEQDAISAWAAERLTLGAARERRSDLFNDFCQWARSNGEKTPTVKSFYEEARRTLGLTDVKTSGTRFMEGAALRSGADDDFTPVAAESDLQAVLH